MNNKNTCYSLYHSLQLFWYFSLIVQRRKTNAKELDASGKRQARGGWGCGAEKKMFFARFFFRLFFALENREAVNSLQLFSFRVFKIKLCLLTLRLVFNQEHAQVVPNLVADFPTFLSVANRVRYFCFRLFSLKWYYPPAFSWPSFIPYVFLQYVLIISLCIVSLC